MTKTIDINCDMGESFGIYSIGNDAAIMPYITSANIACGLHAGDPAHIDRAVQQAKQYGVHIGAHPGYPDLQGFGRRPMDMEPDELEAFIIYQVAALAGFCKANSVELTHVKPHGALYNQSARDQALAATVAKAISRFSHNLVLVGLAGSLSIDAGVEAGLKVAAEAFVDRTYNPDGSLRSRRLPGALITNLEDALKQALNLVNKGVLIVRQGISSEVKVDTLCLHGDNPSAVDIAKTVRTGIEKAGVVATGFC
jgi:UPF0271 protein